MDRQTSNIEAPPTGQRVSTLVGDRLCISCGYNLIGQAVLREPHYQMLIVRCPECGTVASLQEYPLLGRWANRWAVLLAALWFIVLFGMLAGGAGILSGFSMSIAEDAAMTYVQFLQGQFETHRQSAAASGNTAKLMGWGPTDYKDWSDAQDFNALFQQAGGWRHGVRWSALWTLVPYAIIAFTLGCFWAVALMMHGWKGRLIAGFLIMAFAALLAYFVAVLTWYNSQMTWFWADAHRQVGPPILAGALIFGGFVMLIGLLVGRKCVRGMVRVLLPPRLQASLALLWITDGLPAPGGRMKRRQAD